MLIDGVAKFAEFLRVGRLGCQGVLPGHRREISEQVGLQVNTVPPYERAAFVAAEMVLEPDGGLQARGSHVEAGGVVPCLRVLPTKAALRPDGRGEFDAIDAVVEFSWSTENATTTTKHVHGSQDDRCGPRRRSSDRHPCTAHRKSCPDSVAQIVWPLSFSPFPCEHGTRSERGQSGGGGERPERHDPAGRDGLPILCLGSQIDRRQTGGSACPLASRMLPAQKAALDLPLSGIKLRRDQPDAH